MNPRFLFVKFNDRLLKMEKKLKLLKLLKMKKKLKLLMPLLAFVGILFINVSIGEESDSITGSRLLNLESFVTNAFANSEGYCSVSCSDKLCENNKHTDTWQGFNECCTKTYPYVGKSCPN